MKFISKDVIRRSAAYIIVILVMDSSLATAGVPRVSPSKHEFTTDAKSGELSVLNKGSKRFLLRVSATAWSQNVEGKDIYTETSDIVFYPKNINLEEGGQ